MNIIYFHTHDMGRFCEPYGYRTVTPNMLKLAKEGVLFRNAFSLAPTCSPSRAALLTGQYPHQNGMFGLTGQGWRLNDYSKHLSAFLQRQGYVTALSGNQHEDTFPPERLSYNHLLNIETDQGHDDRWTITENAVEFIKQPHEKPFFLSIGYDQNHRHRWEITNERMDQLGLEADDRYIRPLPHLPDHPEIRKETGRFIRAIQYVDRQLGIVMEAVKEAGIEENTLLLFTTDHGIGLPHVKKNLTDLGTGVALIIRGAGGFRGGKVLDAMVTHLDVYPTLCELIGADKPHWLEGKSLLPLLNGAAERLHESIFLQQTYHGKYVPLRGIRTERFKYVRRYGVDRSRTFFTADYSESLKLLNENGYEEMIFPKEQLIDLFFDTNEVHNVIEDPKYAMVASELRSDLDRWQLAKRDPILQGDIPVPRLK